MMPRQRYFKTTRTGLTYEVVTAREIAETIVDPTLWRSSCGFCGLPVQGGTHGVDEHMHVVHDDLDRDLMVRLR
ncbi:hypothetical protein AB0J38_14255 [Streptomyces sp. NPDC050095]|uniref:hypothetical protein n=1 Tax=unclassified Streptomyces TaxID=2593676 RepID=UPI0034378E1B